MITSRKLLWEHHIEFLSRDSVEPSKNKCMVRAPYLLKNYKIMNRIIC